MYLFVFWRIQWCFQYFVSSLDVINVMQVVKLTGWSMHTYSLFHLLTRSKLFPSNLVSVCPSMSPSVSSLSQSIFIEDLDAYTRSQGLNSFVRMEVTFFFRVFGGLIINIACQLVNKTTQQL